MKNFFDDVFDNKILFEKEDLLKTFNETLTESERPLTNADVVDSVLEDLMYDFKQNPERAFTEKEAEIIAAKLNEAKTECKRLIGVVKDRKEMLDNIISKSNKSFTLNISRNSRLKKAATNIFGGRKQEISYSDYMTLIELKKVIEMQETLDLMEGGLDNGSI